MKIITKRAYEPPSESDGYRVLVDRVWPRGLNKDQLRIDCWMKAIAPSNDLRKWFNHEPGKWAGFKKRYFAQLREQREELCKLLEQAGAGPLTLVYGARDESHNNAVALREYLNRLTAR